MNFLQKVSDNKSDTASNFVWKMACHTAGKGKLVTFIFKEMRKVEKKNSSSIFPQFPLNLLKHNLRLIITCAWTHKTTSLINTNFKSSAVCFARLVIFWLSKLYILITAGLVFNAPVFSSVRCQTRYTKSHLLITSVFLGSLLLTSKRISSERLCKLPKYTKNMHSHSS